MRSARQTTSHQLHQHIRTIPPHPLVIFAIASLFDMLLGPVDDKKIPFAIKTLPFAFVTAFALPVFFRLTRRDSWIFGGWVQGNGGEVNMLPTIAGLTGFLRDGCVKALGTCRKLLEKRGKVVEE
jgi:hypothetical protein